MTKMKKTLCKVPFTMVSFHDAMAMLRWGLGLDIIGDDLLIYEVAKATPKDFDDIRLLRAEDVTIEYAIECNKLGYSVTLDDGLAIFIEE